MLRVGSVCTACCCMLLDVVACCCAKFETGQTFQPITPNVSFFRDRRRVAQKCWIRLHSSSNIVGATHDHYAWFTKTYGLYPSHDALYVPTKLGVVASVCMQPKGYRIAVARFHQDYSLLIPHSLLLELWSQNSSRRWDSLIPCAVFRIPKPRIPDSTSKIRIPLNGVTLGTGRGWGGGWLGHIL